MTAHRISSFMRIHINYLRIKNRTWHSVMLSVFFFATSRLSYLFFVFNFNYCIAKAVRFTLIFAISLFTTSNVQQLFCIRSLFRKSILILLKVEKRTSDKITRSKINANYEGGTEWVEKAGMPWKFEVIFVCSLFFFGIRSYILNVGL